MNEFDYTPHMAEKLQPRAGILLGSANRGAKINQFSGTRLHLKANESSTWRRNQQKVIRKMRGSPNEKASKNFICSFFRTHSHFQFVCFFVSYSLHPSSFILSHSLTQEFFILFFFLILSLSSISFFMLHTKIVGNEREVTMTLSPVLFVDRT